MTIARRPKFVTRTMKPWNDRFHVMTTKDNPKLHVFYKELFGKPSHKKHEEMLLHDKGSGETLFNTAHSPFFSTQGSKMMRKTVSQEHFSKTSLKEQKWVSNFNVMGSKNNDRVHKHYQEYFDRPVEYDNQGYKMGIKQFGEVYEKISPSKLRKLRHRMRHQSVSAMEHRQEKIENYGADDPSHTPELNNRPSMGEDQQKISQESAHRIKNSKAIQNALQKQRQRSKRTGNFRRSLERMHKEPEPYASIPGLRSERKGPIDRKKELGWKKIGDPVSTYNELVHKAYKIGFDRL